MKSTSKRCRDCGPESKRPAPFPGPRCASHNRDIKTARKEAKHAAWVLATYGLVAGQYDELKASQGGVCAICQKATGATKKLAVDHDHKTGYVRGLLCGPCNGMLGAARDSAEFFLRAAKYLTDPPALEVIGEVKPE
jgi:hypothetical protein